MSTRTKKTVIREVNQQQAEEAFATFNQATSQLQIIEGRMNVAITRIKEKHEAEISALQDAKEEAFEVLQAYAEANPAIFEKKKSYEFTHGTIGFRTGTPKLVLLKGFQWKAVLELLKGKYSTYVKTKEEVDKEGIIANRANLELKTVGLNVTQDESFYVQPKLEEVATV